MIINGDSSIICKCSCKLIDYARGIIYNSNMYIIQAIWSEKNMEAMHCAIAQQKNVLDEGSHKSLGRKRYSWEMEERPLSLKLI